MAIRKDQSPYYDDFDSSKKFQQILFKPEVAVQVRELNSLQSILKDQIKKFGDSVFKEGSIVIPGENSFDTNYSYVKVTVNNYSAVKDFLTNTGNTAIGTVSSVEAVIDMFVEPTDLDPSTFYLKYTKSSSVSPIFTVGETINIKNVAGDIFATATVNETGVGSVFSTSSGVYYINGNFVYVEAQDIIVSKYSSIIDGIIGFDINEYSITSDEDQSLFDNALGTPNESAPGADRLVIDLKLAFYSNTIPDEFVELAVFESGALKKMARGVEYSVLNDVLAKRTFDESGNYVIDDFGVQIREHLKTDSNKGLYLDGDESLFAVGVETGRGYVRGYEVENLSTTYIEVNKARDTQSINNSSFSLSMGNYINVTDLSSLPALSVHDDITLYSGANQTGTALGTASVRFTRATLAGHQLYIFNIKNADGVADTSYFDSVNSCGNTILSANIVDKTIYGTSVDSYLYKLPVNNVRTLAVNGVQDSSYTKLIRVSDTLDVNGSVTITSPSASTLFTAQVTDYCIVNLVPDNTVVDGSSVAVLGGSPVGSTITLNLGALHASKDVIIQLQVVVQNAVHKTKSVSEFTLTDVPVVDNKVDLGFADVFEIISITSESNDISNDFELVPNRKQRYYDISYINKIAGNASTVTIVGKRFVHSTSGDFFSVDSYSIPYEQIPSDIINGEKTSLSDVIDFRSVIGADLSFDSANAITLPTPVPYSIFRADLDFYLPRIDKLFVDATGSFEVIKGVPSTNPSEPDDVDNTMTLAVLNIPAFTANVSDININKISNRRYTMKDIGVIDNRVTKIEEFIGLNTLEKETADLQIIDPDTGLSRFKNGFFVDQFIDHSLGEYSYSDYRVAVDPIEAKLVPEFDMESIELETSATSNVVVQNGIVTLAYNSVSYASQLSKTTEILCSESPVFRFSGSVKVLNPINNWFSRNIEPDVAIDVNNVSNLNQTFRSWELYWLGYTGQKAIENTKIVNDRYVSTNITPYMRTTEIELECKGFAPNSKLFVFFDNINITTVSYPSNGSLGDSIQCNEFGVANIKCVLPENFAIRAGQKVISVIDNEANDKSIALSYGDCLYTVSGLIEKRKQGSINTRVNRKSELSRNNVNWLNPVAQSFVVDLDGGLFATKLDLFFVSKDIVSGIEIEIREFENGIVSNNVIAGSSVFKLASEVNVGGLKTEFSFDYPIYLQQGNEYAIVIKTNSESYVIEAADTGGVNGSYVSKQPYVGSLYKTQNANWVEIENKDIKFNLYRADFVNSGIIETENKDLDNVQLLNCFSTTSGSSLVTVVMKNHQFRKDQVFEIISATSGNGITFIGSYIVDDVIDYDTFTFVANQTATTTGVTGNTVTISKSIQGHLIEPSYSIIRIPSTDVEYVSNTISSSSFAGSEQTNVAIELTGLVNNQPNILKQPILIDYINKFESTFELRTTKSNLSPVLDLYSSSLIVVHNKINDNDFTKYISKIAVLDDGAIGIQCILDVINPITAEVKLKYRVGNSEEEIEASQFSDLTQLTNSQFSETTYSTQEYSVTDLTEFTHYQIMIVLNSSSDTAIPSCKRLRTIALGT